MHSLSVTRFKSYSKLSISGFNPHINIIIGGNGQGKSNLFKGMVDLILALSFVLSDRLQVNRTEFNNCVHRGVEVSNE
jgi:recombinational DNA repair ATPase RecF